jgi:PST family polysaccharide transporter
VGVYLALHDFGVWALVWQQLVNQFTTTLLTIVYGKWTPSLVFSNEQFKKIMKFSFPLMSAQLISSVSNNIMELLIGVILGPAALGFYRVGGRALYILQDILLKPFEHTALSALSRINVLASQAEGTIRMIRMSSCLTFPIFFGAAAIAPEFVILAFGEKWAVSGHIMTILAIGVAPLIVGYNINAALTASNNSRLVMSQASIAFAINCTLGAIVVPFGIVATAFGFAFRNYLITLINLYFFRKIFGQGIIQMLKVITPTLLASTIMFIVVTQAKVMLTGKLPLAIDIIVLCAIGGATYSLLMATLFRQETRNFFRESIDLAPAKLKPMIVALQGLIKLT